MLTTIVLLQVLTATESHCVFAGAQYDLVVFAAAPQNVTVSVPLPIVTVVLVEATVEIHDIWAASQQGY